MSDHEAQRSLSKYVGVVLLLLLFLTSLVLLLVSTFIPHDDEIARELVRDLGIGFMVSATVGGLYEFHSRFRMDVRRIKEVLDVVMGEITRDDIWDEVKKQVITRHWIREDLTIRLRFEGTAPDGAPPHLKVLWVHMSYTVVNLTETDQQVAIDHRLDEHLAHGEFPRFNEAKIDRHVVDLQQLRDGHFKHKFELKPKEVEHISIAREELIPVPGSYTLVLGSIVKGVKITVDDLPDGVNGYVAIRPRTSLLALKVTDTLDAELGDMLLFPGQAIEFKFGERRRAELPETAVAGKIVGEAELVEAVPD